MSYFGGNQVPWWKEQMEIEYKLSLNGPTCGKIPPGSYESRWLGFRGQRRAAEGLRSQDLACPWRKLRKLVHPAVLLCSSYTCHQGCSNLGWASQTLRESAGQVCPFWTTCVQREIHILRTHLGFWMILILNINWEHLRSLQSLLDLQERWELRGDCGLREEVYSSFDEIRSFLKIGKFRKFSEVLVLSYIYSLVLSEVKVYRMEDQGTQAWERFVWITYLICGFWFFCLQGFSHGAVSSLGWAQEGGEGQSAVRLCPWSVLCGGRSIRVLALWAQINVVQFIFIPLSVWHNPGAGVCPCSLNFSWERNVSVWSRTFMTKPIFSLSFPPN